jgi:hypothetical protein
MLTLPLLLSSVQHLQSAFLDVIQVWQGRFDQQISHLSKSTVIIR